MPKKDERVDAYIAKSRDFAKPILIHLRKLVHTACPEVTETLKWSMPFFDYKGPLANMAAFTRHCSFGFWKASLLEDKTGSLKSQGDEGMGALGKIASLEDLPADDVIVDFILQAMNLNDNNISVPRAAKSAPKELVIPADLLEALASNEKAAETFDKFPPSCRREYVEWITEAKTEATRGKRLATTVEWLNEGKRRNWKYEKC